MEDPDRTTRALEALRRRYAPDTLLDLSEATADSVGAVLRAVTPAVLEEVRRELRVRRAAPVWTGRRNG